MSEQALQRIAENKKTKNPALDLSHCGLTTLPSELLECVWLTELDLSWNRALDNLSSLTALTNLQKLDFSYTEVTDLSPLATLTNLQQLRCYCTQANDLSPLADLVNLQQLDFSDTQVADLSPLAALVNLQQLNCSRTQVTNLSPVAVLFNLQQLNCSYTLVAELSPLTALANLQELKCSGTQVADLSPLVALSNLQQFSCSYTEVADLSPILFLIQQDIPVIWKQDYPENNFIRVQYCPLICPPVEIASDSPQAVRDYFEELGEKGRRLNEVKVIFLGEASAGKTSLVRRLMGEPFDKKESQTHGIRIRKAPFMMDDGDVVTAHFWDFGGQEVMSATHQFFLSQRSVYVLLLNSRNDDQAEKWLKHAESFGGRSPVLIVLNKIDENPSFEVERKSLKEKYPQIRDFFRLSCAEENNKGFAEFREALRQEIDRSDTRRTPFPAHWLEVKEYFSTMQADYIESAEYRRVCADHGVTRLVSQDVLLQFLHDLGVVINFRNLQYFDTQILNPIWLTNGVYRIINSGLVADNGGLLREDDFDGVINDPRYQRNDTSERQFIYPKINCTTSCG